jgi:hypothetical protein
MKIKLLTLGVLIGSMSSSVLAADAQLTAAFKTIKDVTITQVAGNELTINGLQMASGSTCTVSTSGDDHTDTSFAGDTLMLMSSVGLAAQGSTYGATAGAGCSTGTSVPGIYEIDGASGADVTITLATGTAGGITYTPFGCASDYNGAADGDVCTSTVVGNTTITLADSADETVSAGNGQPVAGKSRLQLNGSVTSSIGLTAATAYTIPFDIVVTY